MTMMRCPHTTMMELVATHSTASVLDTQVSKRTDVTMTIHTERGYQGVPLNQNEGALLQFNRGTDGWRRINAPSSGGGPEQQGRRKEGPRGAWLGPRVGLYITPADSRVNLQSSGRQVDLYLGSNDRLVES